MRRTCLAVMFTAFVHVTTSEIARCEEPQPSADKLAMRYGVRANLTSYPQAKPRESLESIVNAIKADNVAYLLAHLVWPAEVDQQFGGDREKFLQLTRRSTPEKSRKLADALARHLAKGKWTIGSHTARSQIDGLPDVTLSRLADRWFMHNTPSE